MKIELLEEIAEKVRTQTLNGEEPSAYRAGFNYAFQCLLPKVREMNEWVDTYDRP